MRQHEHVMPRLSTRAFFGVTALLFVVSAALPFACCASMPSAICRQAPPGVA